MIRQTVRHHHLFNLACTARLVECGQVAKGRTEGYITIP